MDRLGVLEALSEQALARELARLRDRRDAADRITAEQARLNRRVIAEQRRDDLASLADLAAADRFSHAVGERLPALAAARMDAQQDVERALAAARRAHGRSEAAAFLIRAHTARRAAVAARREEERLSWISRPGPPPQNS